MSEKVLFPAEWSSITSESFQDGKLLCGMGFVLRSKKKNNENGFSTAFATGSLGPKVQLFNLDQSLNFFLYRSMFFDGAIDSFINFRPKLLVQKFGQTGDKIS